ncbi:MAG: hypothetical protein RML72_01825 [Bacteroidia bacterium]|nr:hypothetical protein [Bacteroidia bacterium]MDW8157599.1 hypothetical protein [Bacteroidia bacterium]
MRPSARGVHHEFAWEAKYLKREQEGLVGETINRAKERLLGYYGRDSFLQSRRMLHLGVVVIVRDKVYYEEIKR